MTRTSTESRATLGAPTSRRRGAIAGIGLGLACAAACAFPLLAAGGALAGVAAIAAGWWWLAAAAALAVGVGWWWARSRRRGVDEALTGDACQGSCSVGPDGAGCGCRPS